MAKDTCQEQNFNREIILDRHEADSEEKRPDDEKLWTGLWHATIPKEFIIIASQENFNGSVWCVYSYITTRIDLQSGKTRRLKPAEICEALDISGSTLDRAKATLKDYGFISEDAGDGSVYHAKDIQVATERAKNRKIIKSKESRIAKHEAFITDEETARGHKLSMTKRTELIRTEFNETYSPVLV